MVASGYGCAGDFDSGHGNQPNVVDEPHLNGLSTKKMVEIGASSYFEGESIAKITRVRFRFGPFVFVLRVLLSTRVVENPSHET